MNGGRLIYVIGASGSGKDSLMRYARERLAGDPACQFAHRYITRPPDAGGENHVALTAEEFETRRKTGLFAMHWRSHGLDYGIGIEINQWLGKGVTVVVNGSREYLPEASAQYRELLPVWIEVDPEVLRERLLARGRESFADIEERLARHRLLQGAHRAGKRVYNNGALEMAGEQLIGFIGRYRGARSCA